MPPVKAFFAVEEKESDTRIKWKRNWCQELNWAYFLGEIPTAFVNAFKKLL